ncbi:MAG TPA: copper ion binding protein, partial [Bacillales bacterium]|nr:copper ion binding protein [Bacillales bacterium]
MGQKELSLEVTGMTCASCSTRIENKLNAMDGVRANVNLAMERAKVKYDEGSVHPDDIIGKIEKLGYGVPDEKVELDIRGMTCASCSGRIEKGLNRMRGIGKANINLATESGIVEYSPGVVTLDEILSKVKSLGYEGVVKQDRDETKDHKEAEIRKKKVHLTISILLSLPLAYTMFGHAGLPVPGILMNMWFQFALATIVQ